MLIDILNGIAKELKEHKRDKKALLEMYIEKRLNDSLSVYYKELSNSVNYLEYKNSIKVMRKLNKE